MKPAPRRSPLKVLVVDVGGTHVKCLASGQQQWRRFASGPNLTPEAMVRAVMKLTADWLVDVIALGYPGVVRDGVPMREPHHLGRGWVGFDFERAFGRPVKIINDAALQALGCYRGGTMLFLGLGTGLGSALIVNDVVLAMELGHLRRGKGRTYENLLGKHGFKRLGKKKWRRRVNTTVQGFSDALLPDDIVVGGGQADRLKRLPPRTRRGDNAAAFAGGLRLWGAPTPGPDRARKRERMPDRAHRRSART
jgi:polyphosphate glucokinase